MALGEQGKAVQQYKEAIDDLPDFPEAHFNLAAALGAGRYRWRTASLRRLKVRPNYVKALNNLGMLFFNQGDFTAAAQEFQKALMSIPIMRWHRTISASP